MYNIRLDHFESRNIWGEQDQKKKIEMRNELKEDAVNSVKATFIIDALAKAESVQVSDQEVMQVLYYEQCKWDKILKKL